MRVVIGDQSLDDAELFIFDKDGTLIDIHHYWAQMIRFRAKRLSDLYLGGDGSSGICEAMGLNLETNKLKPEGPVGIKPRQSIMEEAHRYLSQYSNTVTLEDVSDVFKEVDSYSTQKIHELLKPLPGVFKLLDSLRNAGLKTALATNDITERALLAADSLNMKKHFDVIVGGDSVPNAKPSPDLVDFITSRLGIRNENSIVVGDSIADLMMAKNAGSKFIGVKTGLHSDDFLQSCDYVVETLEDIALQDS